MSKIFKKINIVLAFMSMTSLGHAYGDGTRSSCAESTSWCSCLPEWCGKAFVSADLLYWRAFESGLDVCEPSQQSDIISSDGFVTSRFVGRGHDLHYKWDPGFRIGTGYEFADRCGCGGWDIGAYWTHFHSHAHGTRNHASSNTDLINSASTNKLNGLRWKLNLDVVDIVAGYKYDFNSCLAIRPFIGVRGARIHQNVHLDESGFSGDSSSSSSSSSSASSFTTQDTLLLTSSTKNKQKFKGVGPLLGFEADWKIGCGFSFYGSVDIAWLYGKHRVKLTETQEFVDALDFCELRKRVDASVAVGDAALGIRWETCFCNDMRLYVQLGVEHHRYFDFNRLGQYGDLSFDGVNLGGGFEF